ncbi:hypothetical protein [Anaerococcus hydrogenalis]|uniref:hypothetical protein n=1 Tax=Anaerococcus hydrogenalis TaxID=33029 RepID=UPI00288AD681|nr:hypothetical protein [Anaerococcus hydrogenalis]
MKKKILTTSLALALGLTLVVPTATAKADELDDLLNGATEIGGELDQNTEDLDKLDKKKVVVPAAKIEDIAKPNKKKINHQTHHQTKMIKKKMKKIKIIKMKKKNHQPHHLIKKTKKKMEKTKTIKIIKMMINQKKMKKMMAKRN